MYLTHRFPKALENIVIGDRSSGAHRYGLDDELVLKQAIDLVPELFAALAICRDVPGNSYPITSDVELEAALAALTQGQAQLEFEGVHISSADRFPHEFLPVEDVADLLRKVYVAILIDHNERGRRTQEAFEASKEGFVPSHPYRAEGE